MIPSLVRKDAKFFTGNRDIVQLGIVSFKVGNRSSVRAITSDNHSKVRKLAELEILLLPW